MKLDIQYFADGKVVIETDLDTKSFESGLGKLGSLAKKGFKAIATSIGAVSTAMAAALGYGVKYNSEIEQLQTSFEVMTGSADKAAEVVQKLKDVGSKTPYDLKGLAQTTQTLMQYGLTADEAYQATINFGDIAQGSAEKMQSIALAYGQMSSAGKVNMQDIKQMINAGFNPLQAIAEMTGETMAEVTARYEDNAISVEEVTKAMQFASSEGGKYYQSMEKQSQTLEGQMSTLKDNASSLAGTLANDLSGTISGQVLPSINDLLTSMETAFNEDGISGLAEALGNGIASMVTKISEEAPKFIKVATTIIQNLINGIKQNLPTIVKSAISIVKQLTTTILKMLPQILEMGIEILIELAKGISEALPELIPTMVRVIMDIVNILLDHIDEIIEAGIVLLVALTEGIMNALPELVSRLPEIIIKITNTLIQLSPQLLSAALRIIMALAEGLIKYIPEMVSRIPQIIKSMVSALGQGVKDFVNIGANLLKGLWQGISNTTTWLINKVKGIGSSITKAVKSVLGIHSPSRVFRDEIGKNLALGLGIGFEKEIDNVYDKMQNAVDLETSKMSANVESNGTYQMAMAGLPTFNLTNDLVVEAKVDEGTLFRTNERLQSQNNLQTVFSRG